jgi:UDP-N-acetylglucosamine 3-dehydrogenase
MGTYHARAYASLPQTQLAAISNDGLAALHLAAHDFSVPGYQDFREMLAKEHLDLVSIATPTLTHYEIAREVLLAGVHVLIEKPIAYTVDEAQSLIQIAQQHSLVLMVGYIERFNPVIREVKRCLDLEMLGTILQFHSRRMGPFPDRDQDTGVIHELATHDIDCARYLFKAGIERIYAEILSVATPEQEDAVWSLLHFNSGVTGLIEASRISPEKIRSLEVIGTAGRLRANFLTQELFRYENGVEQIIPIPKGDALLAEIKAFAQAVSTGAPPPITGQDGLEVLKIAHDLIVSGRTHQTIHTPNTIEAD